MSGTEQIATITIITYIPTTQINKFRYFISPESDDDEEEEEEEDEDEEADAMYENSMKKVPDEHTTELQLPHGQHVIILKPSRDQELLFSQNIM